MVIRINGFILGVARLTRRSVIRGSLEGGTSSVGNFPDGASPYGCLDMSGNVWEWTQDWFDADDYKNSPAKDPQGANKTERRSVRGGSFAHFRRRARVAACYGGTPGYIDGSIGFRCASS